VYDHSDPFSELRSLAEQGGAIVVGELTQNLAKPVAGTFMGVGKVEELKQLCEALDASTVIFDHGLSPKQIAKIEEICGRKVIDRSELILDIFASRATSAEAQLQVELAQLEYTYPRLRAMWDHLERIVGHGGIGGIGTRGPGEQQLEIDRRLVQARKNDLEAQISTVQERKRREVRERKRENFTVGIVGYTNAGKSTLFNTLTSGGAYADNRLFATLMTRTRQWDLGGGLNVLLSDTVGFVRDLPHNLIAAFRATLEEATHADVLLIVLDVADPAAELQYSTVTQTLDELLAGVREREERDGHAWSPPERIVLLNKADKLRSNAELLVWQQKAPGSLAICALPGENQTGHAELISRMRAAAKGQVQELRLTVAMKDSKVIHLIENRAEVLSREYDGASAIFRVRIGRRQLDQLRVGGAKLTIEPLDGTLPPPPVSGPVDAWSSRG
jgi:GTP-binding protein HflX